MSARAHVFVAIVCVLTIAFVLFLLRRRKLKSKFSLLWVTMSVAFMVFAAFPAVYERFSDLVGIEYTPTTILFVAVVFLFGIVVHYSWELSRQEERIRILAEQVAILGHRVGEPAEVPAAPATPDDGSDQQ